MNGEQRQAVRTMAADLVTLMSKLRVQRDTFLRAGAAACKLASKVDRTTPLP